MAALPAVNDLVMLVDERGETCRSRVEDEDGVLLAVGRPLEDGWPAHGGAPFELHWGTPRGLWTTTTELWRTEEGEVDLWWLEVLEEPLLHQRRSYVRGHAPTTLDPVSLSWPARSRDIPTGRLLDLSEGGARLAVETCEELPEGETVAVSVDAGDDVLDLCGTVFRATRYRRELELVLAFDELPDALASQVRTAVFRWQRLARG